MPGPWITSAELRRRLADRMSQEEDDLPPKWTQIITDAVTSATNDITTLLIGRGYTIAQIDQWDRRLEFSYSQGLFWCYVNGIGAGTYSDVFIKQLDRRDELRKDLAISINGVIVLPEAGVDPNDDIDGGGSVSGGQFKDDRWRFKRNKVF